MNTMVERTIQVLKLRPRPWPSGKPFRDEWVYVREVGEGEKPAMMAKDIGSALLWLAIAYWL
jgi:hypothetical protein